MQQLRVPFIALLLALYLLPLSPEQVGAVSGGSLWHYAVYMFFHANLFHLLGTLCRCTWCGSFVPITP